MRREFFKSLINLLTDISEDINIHKLQEWMLWKSDVERVGKSLEEKAKKPPRNSA